MAEKNKYGFGPGCLASNGLSAANPDQLTESLQAFASSPRTKSRLVFMSLLTSPDGATVSNWAQPLNPISTMAPMTFAKFQIIAVQNLDTRGRDRQSISPDLSQELVEQVGRADGQMRRRIFRIGGMSEADLYSVKADAFGQLDGGRFGFKLEVPVRRTDFQSCVTSLQPRCQSSGSERGSAGPDELAPIHGKRRVPIGRTYGPIHTGSAGRREPLPAPGCPIPMAGVVNGVFMEITTQMSV